MLKIIAIATIVCYWIDLSGITTTIKKLIWKWVFGKNKPYQEFELKPFDCVLCMTHHLCAIYLLIIGEFTIFNYLLVCIISYLTSSISSILLLIKDIIDLIIYKANNIFFRK